MKIDLNKFFKKSETISFSKEKKEGIRLKLETFIKETPVIVQEVTSARNEFRWFVYLSRHTAMVSVLFVVFVVGSTGLLAEGTLPGDFLYGVKTNINEQVRGLFVGGSQDRAEWNLELAERRLVEIGKLSAEDRLSEEQREELKRKIINHTDKAIEAVSLKEELSGNEKSLESRVELLQTKKRETTPFVEIESEASKENLEQVGVQNNEEIRVRIEKSEEKINSITAILNNIKNIETARVIHIKALIIKARESLYEARSDLRGGDEVSSNLENADRLIRSAEEIINNIPEDTNDFEIDRAQESAVNKSTEILKEGNLRKRVLEDQER